MAGCLNNRGNTVVVIHFPSNRFTGLPLVVALIPHRGLYGFLLVPLLHPFLLHQAKHHGHGQHCALLRVHSNYGHPLLPVYW